MNILVTGASGFLGQAICRLLVERGYNVTGYNRGHYPALTALGVREIQGDLADAKAVLAASKNRDAVFHAGAKAGAWGGFQSYYDANVKGTLNVIAACRKQGITRLIYTSTPSVVHAGSRPVRGGNEENTPYARRYKAWYPATKRIAEEQVIAANGTDLLTVSLRPRLIWGPGDNQLLPRLVSRAWVGRLRFVGTGENLVDTTYIDNAAQAHLDAFDHLQPGARCAGRVYFISNGEPKPIAEVVNALLRAAGAPEVKKRIPFPLAYAVGALGETVYRVLRLQGEPPMTRFLAEQLSTPQWYDIGAAARDLGYRPRVSMAEGLRRLSEWWREHGMNSPDGNSGNKR